jgi:hypothetical protein
MKTTSLICLLAFSFSTFAQTIRRVNNSPNITGVNIYATLQAAHDAAVNDDIIYVEPSLASYANLTCVKRLTIIGNGWADSYGNITPNPPTNSTAGIWSCGHVPVVTEPVQISTGHTVTLNVNGTAKSLDLRGILNQQATRVLTIQGN